jgi:hypothetical protein
MDARAFDQNRLSVRHVTEGTSLPPAAAYLPRHEAEGRRAIGLSARLSLFFAAASGYLHLGDAKFTKRKQLLLIAQN